MKALLWHNQRDVRVEEVPEPTVRPGAVKIKIKWCGICGTDLHEYLAGPIFIPTEEHPLTHVKAPVILGHEFSGEVVEIGEGVTSHKVGDRVVVEPIYSCGKCEACKHGHYNVCEQLVFHGLGGEGGGFSEYTVVPENMVHHIPDEMTYEQGALVEPAAVAVHAVRQSKLKEGEAVAVFGCGPIGLLVIQAAKAAGATPIIAVELSKERQELAKLAGADYVLNPATQDVLAEIRNVTNGLGVNVSFEVTGVEVVLRQAIESTSFEGQTVIVSVWEKDATITPNNLVLKEKEVIGILGYRHIFPAVIKLISSGQIQAEKLITKKITVDQVVEEGFEALVKDKTQVKILVSPK
ncbi:(R,R)-butanediol dehydrogenase [Bacillus sp. JJ1127]|uniref:(R,R)-butanediol dehydrogenase n=1 Tax=Bacillus sp. JJ1127 TaxID=3122952 RepID=UPI002FFE72B2